MQPLLSESINSDDGNHKSWVAIQQYWQELTESFDEENMDNCIPLALQKIPKPLPTVRNSARTNIRIPNQTALDPTDANQKHIDKSLTGPAFDFTYFADNPKRLGFGEHSAILPSEDF